MIWKTLGFQLAAVIAVVGRLVFLAPLSNGDRPAQSIAPPGGSSWPPSSIRDISLPTTADIPPPSTDDAGVALQRPSAGPLWSQGAEHDAEENAAHHWQKHGGEFRELHSERDYTNAAHDFVNHPPAGVEIKHNNRGDTLIYDPQTNTFAVESRDGAPRTMFRPHSGRAYWDRQR